MRTCSSRCWTSRDTDRSPTCSVSAIALWRGPALAGFEHEDWARGFAARLTELKHIADDDLGKALLDRGSVADAVAHSRESSPSSRCGNARTGC